MSSEAPQVVTSDANVLSLPIRFTAGVVGLLLFAFFAVRLGVELAEARDWAVYRQNAILPPWIEFGFTLLACLCGCIGAVDVTSGKGTLKRTNGFLFGALIWCVVNKVSLPYAALNFSLAIAALVAFVVTVTMSMWLPKRG